MIRAWAQTMFPVYFGFALDNICCASFGVAPACQSCCARMRAPKSLLHESSFYCTMMATRLLGPFCLGRTFATAKLPFLYIKSFQTLHCVVLFTLDRRMRRTLESFGKGRDITYWLSEIGMKYTWSLMNKPGLCYDIHQTDLFELRSLLACFFFPAPICSRDSCYLK